MTVTVHIGNALDVLRNMASGIAHVCFSSPPYYGKRDYGVEASVWGGSPECRRVWGGELLDRSKRSPGTQGGSLTGDGRYQAEACRFEIRSNFCVECGAWKGALGLEPTPELYVEHLVEIFGEVRRVLRADGTLWLNIGDTYATGAGRVGDHPGGGEQGENWAGRPKPGATSRAGHRGKKTRATRDGDHAGINTAMAALGPMTQPNRMPLPGFKPKDLIGIPWRVAMALQAPKYIGKIKSESDRVWLSAMIEGEGCIYISRSAAGSATGRKRADGSRSKRSADCFGPGIRLCNTDEALVWRCYEIAKVGTVRKAEKAGRRAYWEWCVWSDQARDVLAEIYPHLVAKHHEARLAFATPSSGEQATAAWLSLKSIHHGQQPTIDFKPPPTLWQQGWWLRGENIWAKPNPMPESITDRCTVAHETVFLLSKSEQYYFDAAAIAEPANYPPGGTHDDVLQGGFNDKGEIPLTRHRAFRAIRQTRNKRTVWTIPTSPFAEAHFATCPPALVEPCLKAGTSARGCCVKCSTGWERVVRKAFAPQQDVDPAKGVRGAGDQKPMDETNGWDGYPRGTTEVETLGWWPGCRCDESLPKSLPAYPKRPKRAAPADEVTAWEGACAAVDDVRRKMCAAVADRPTVRPRAIDPFGGAGTTALVADRLQLDCVLIEMNPAYAKMARQRIDNEAGLFAERAAE